MGIKYCEEGEWHVERQEGEVVIPMIALIEGGMRVPMSPVTRDYLRAHRLAPTQYPPNVFRILGCVDALNEIMGLGLDRKSTRLNSSHPIPSRMPSSA